MSGPADLAFVGGGVYTVDAARPWVEAVVSDRPAFLVNRDHHGAWANSRALELAGITRDTPDPADGRIERDAGGEPVGTLQEGAMSLMERVVPPVSMQDRLRGILVA